MSIDPIFELNVNCGFDNGRKTNHYFANKVKIL